MDNLNISSYIKALQYGLQEPNSNEDVCNLIFNSIIQQEHFANTYEVVNIDSKTVSNLINKKSEVHQTIKTASADSKIAAETVSYFSNIIIPTLHPYTKNEALERILKTIQLDETLAESVKFLLTNFYNVGAFSEFLAESFLYAINRVNKITNDSTVEDHIPFITETNNKCSYPCCQNQLIIKKKDKILNKYKIVKIYPDDLDSSLTEEFNAIFPPPKNLNMTSNLIALCNDCADDYLASRSTEEYQTLLKLKKQLIDENKLMDKLNSISLEYQIKDVLNAICDIDDMNKLSSSLLTPLKIEQKIKKENVVLINTIKHQVLTYYGFIENILSINERDKKSFKLIVSQINSCFRSLELGDKTQDEIIQALKDWILFKTNLDTNYTNACYIVISFFIQNCEVFDEIS